jgi:hypothetical protein
MNAKFLPGWHDTDDPISRIRHRDSGCEDQTTQNACSQWQRDLQSIDFILLSDAAQFDAGESSFHYSRTVIFHR